MISFRKLLPADALSYRAIRLESLKNFPRSFCSAYAEQVHLPQLFLEGHILTQSPDKWVMGAFDEHTLIGICGFRQMGIQRLRHHGEIIQMYVKPTHSGQKIGFNLVRAASEEAFLNPEIHHITLEVATDVSSANKVYEQAGFKEYGRHPNYFRDGEVFTDLRLMRLERQSL